MKELNPLQPQVAPCACSQEAEPAAQDTPAPRAPLSTRNKFVLGAALLVVWGLVYWQLKPFSQWLAFSVFGLEPESHLGEAVQFFIYDTPKVLMLLILVVFGVGILRSYFSPEAARRILSGKRKGFGHVLAALLGVATPFCSCSAVPLFIGFVTASVPLGVTFSFLIAAPMVNEVALVLLWGLLGWKVALFYMGAGLLTAIVAGFVIGRLKMENHMQDWVRHIRENGTQEHAEDKTWSDRIDYALGTVKEIVGKVWLYVVIGIGVGAAIHGYVPEGFLASIMGKDAWWSVPAAVVLGVPMYSNAAGVVPVLSALLEKGAALGTALAFMMSVIGLSLPEMVILRKVLKLKLLAVFVGVLACGILVVGFVFNLTLAH